MKFRLPVSFFSTGTPLEINKIYTKDYKASKNVDTKIH